MAQQIIRQPDGKYAVFSTIVDDFTLFGATPEEIIEAWIEGYRVELTRKVRKIVTALEMGKKPYAQFTMTWEEALEHIETIHGEKRASTVYNKLKGE